MLTDLADSAELFHTADGTAFVALMIDGHRENAAHSQCPLSNLVQASILRGHGLPTERGGDRVSVAVPAAYDHVTTASENEWATRRPPLDCRFTR